MASTATAKMPFREKLKKAFKTNSPASSKTSSPTIAQQEMRWPSNVYRPDEPMPRPKYRAPVKKEHKEKLEAFSFGSSWRRRSHVSIHSPMGSRLPSRRNSRVSRTSFSGPPAGKRDSFDARRRSQANASRNNSITAQPDTARRYRQSLRIAQQMKLQTEHEKRGDEDVANVGISRFNSPDPTPQIHVYHASPTLAGSPATASAASTPPYTTPGIAHDDDGDDDLQHHGGDGDGYFPAQDQHVRSSATRDSSSAASKADSGQAGQHIFSNLAASPSSVAADHGRLFGGEGFEAAIFSDEELAKAMARSRMSTYQALPA